MYQALYRKYRPRSFSDVVGQEHVTVTLRRQVESGRTSHAYLFVGTRGTGKTTCAKILSRALNCEHPIGGDPCNECASCRGIESGGILDVVEIDAASNNGVDNIRAIRDEAVYTPASVKKRVYIIDEVHMLSASAFNALLKILEEPPEHLVFILATTELGKVPATILSRCQHFSFRRIMPEDIAARLRYVAEKEGFTLTDGAAALLARLGDGSMRDALSLLDQCVTGDTVDEKGVLDAVGLVGSAGTAELWEKLAEGSLPEAMELLDRIYYGGADLGAVLSDLLSLLRDMIMVRVAPRGSRALLTGAFDGERLRQLSRDIPSRALLAASETLQGALDTMREARDKRTKTELTLIRLSRQLSGERDVADSAAAPTEKPAAPAEKPAPRAAETRERPSAAAAAGAAAEPKPAEGPVPEGGTPPADSPSNGGGAQEADWWAAALQSLGDVDPNATRFLSDGGNVAPELVGGNLVLHTKNDFVLMMVNTPAVKSAVTQAVSRVLGRSVSVSFAGGGIPAGGANTGTEDKLRDLERFGGIVKFK